MENERELASFLRVLGPPTIKPYDAVMPEERMKPVNLPMRPDYEPVWSDLCDVLRIFVTGGVIGALLMWAALR